MVSRRRHPTGFNSLKRRTSEAARNRPGKRPGDVAVAAGQQDILRWRAGPVSGIEGKRRLLDIVFGRTMVITLLLVLQIAIMVLGAHYLGRYYPALTIVLRVMSVAVIIYLVNQVGSATTRSPWIISSWHCRPFGVLLYLFVQLDIGHRYANRRVQESILSTVQYVPRQTELMARLRTELPEVHNLAEYTLRSGDYPVYENTAVTYYPMGQDKIGSAHGCCSGKGTSFP